MVKKEKNKLIDAHHVITRWTIKGNHQINYQNYYHQWLFSRKTLAEVSFDLGIFYPKLIKEFDRIDVDEGL